MEVRKDTEMSKSQESHDNILRTSERYADGSIYIYRLIGRSRRSKSGEAEMYSVNVSMSSPEATTTAEVTDAFSDIGKALVFYTKAVANLLTPRNLPDVLADET